MFASSGYFRSISCPYFNSGLCERPYCHFRHVKSAEGGDGGGPRSNNYLDELVGMGGIQINNSSNVAASLATTTSTAGVSSRQSMLSMVGSALQHVQKAPIKRFPDYKPTPITNNLPRIIPRQSGPKSARYQLPVVPEYRPTPIHILQQRPPAPSKTHSIPEQSVAVEQDNHQWKNQKRVTLADCEKITTKRKSSEEDETLMKKAKIGERVNKKKTSDFKSEKISTENESETTIAKNDKVVVDKPFSKTDNIFEKLKAKLGPGVSKITSGENSAKQVLKNNSNKESKSDIAESQVSNAIDSFIQNHKDDKDDKSGHEKENKMETEKNYTSSEEYEKSNTTKNASKVIKISTSKKSSSNHSAENPAIGKHDEKDKDICDLEEADSPIEVKDEVCSEEVKLPENISEISSERYDKTNYKTSNKLASSGDKHSKDSHSKYHKKSSSSASSRHTSKNTLSSHSSNKSSSHLSHNHSLSSHASSSHSSSNRSSSSHSSSNRSSSSHSSSNRSSSSHSSSNRSSSSHSSSNRSSSSHPISSRSSSSHSSSHSSSKHSSKHTSPDRELSVKQSSSDHIVSKHSSSKSKSTSSSSSQLSHSEHKKSEHLSSSNSHDRKPKSKVSSHSSSSHTHKSKSSSRTSSSSQSDSSSVSSGHSASHRHKKKHPKAAVISSEPSKAEKYIEKSEMRKVEAVKGRSDRLSNRSISHSDLFGEDSDDEGAAIVISDSDGKVSNDQCSYHHTSETSSSESDLSDIEEANEDDERLSVEKEPPILNKKVQSATFPDKKRVAHRPMAEMETRKKSLFCQRPARPSPSQEMINRLQKLQKKAQEEREAIQQSPAVSTSVLSPMKSCKKRVAHEPNIVISSSDTKQGNVKRTLGTQKKRTAHQPKKTTLKRPTVQLDAAGKVAASIRQRYLDQMIDECLKIYHIEEEAFARALTEEKTVYDRCSSRNIYLNFSVNAIKRLRSESGTENNTSKATPKKGLSHAALLGGAKAAVTSFTVHRSAPLHKSPENLKDIPLYNQLKRYIMTEEQLVENGFPCPSPDEEGVAVIKSRDNEKRTQMVSRTGERLCCRCGKRFMILPNGEYVKQEDCVYHWGKSWKRKVQGSIQSRYTCCQSDSSGSGCAIAPNHVHEFNKSTDFDSYASTEPKTPPRDGDYGVYALDCEMIYTTHGSELARITVIGPDLEPVYEEVVKPKHKILDFNTRFSGLRSEDMRGVKTSLQDVQFDLQQLFNTKTILIGHSLESDFTALKLIHSTVVDTSVVFPHKLGAPYKRALRNLMVECLKKIIQEDVGGHDSREDAAACMELMLWKLKEDNRKKSHR